MEELKAEVMKLSPGKDDILVVKLDHEPYEGELEQIEDYVKNAIGDDTKVLTFLPGYQIEVIPGLNRNRHYGIWIPRTGENDSDGWLTFANDMIFCTRSLGMAIVKQRNGELAGKGKVRVFNDDGTPGEVV